LKSRLGRDTIHCKEYDSTRTNHTSIAGRGTLMSYDDAVCEQLESVVAENDYIKKISNMKISIASAAPVRHTLDEIDDRLLKIIRELDR
jgi:hypothetical protein